MLILFHPMPGGDNALDGIDDVVDRWLIVHVGQLILTPLLFLAVWRLLDGLSSAAATISRCALVVWTVFFSAYDAVQGIATGLLVRHADGVPDTNGTPSPKPSTTSSWTAASPATSPPCKWSPAQRG